MKVAVDLFLNFNHYREGISVYNKFLFQALLQQYTEIFLEFWVDKRNEDEFYQAYKCLFDDYPNRISVILTEKQERLEQHIKSSKYDVVFADIYRVKSSHFSTAPKVFVLHDMYRIPLRDLYIEQEPNIDISNKEIIDNLSLFAKEGTNFIVSSTYIKNEQLLRYISSARRDKITVIPYPPMLKIFKKEKILSEKRFRAKFKIKGQYIPYASRNKPNKNLIVLLQALKQLRDKGINLKLVTTGTMSSVPIVARYVNEHHLHNLIVEVGSLSEEDLFALYRYAAVAVIPTIIEGPGMSQQGLEALLLEKPVIHSKALGIKESLQSVGLTMKTADLNWFDLDDDKALATKIKEVLENPLPHIRKQKHIINAYTNRKWEDVAGSTMKVFKKAIEENKKHPLVAKNEKTTRASIQSQGKAQKKFFSFYSEKISNDEKIERYFWGLYKKISSPKQEKYYFLGIKVFRKKKLPQNLPKNNIDSFQNFSCLYAETFFPELMDKYVSTSKQIGNVFIDEEYNRMLFDRLKHFIPQPTEDIIFMQLKDRFFYNYDKYLRNRLPSEPIRRLFITTGTLSLINALCYIEQSGNEDKYEDTMLIFGAITSQLIEDIIRALDKTKFKKVIFCKKQRANISDNIIVHSLYEVDECIFVAHERTYPVLKAYYRKAKLTIIQESLAFFPYSEQLATLPDMYHCNYSNKLDYAYPETGNLQIEMNREIYLRKIKDIGVKLNLKIKTKFGKKVILFCGADNATGMMLHEDTTLTIIKKLTQKGYVVLFKKHPRDQKDYEAMGVEVLDTAYPIEFYDLSEVTAILAFRSNLLFTLQDLDVPVFYVLPEETMVFDRFKDKFTEFQISQSKRASFCVQNYVLPMQELLDADMNKSANELRKEFLTKQKALLDSQPRLSENKEFKKQFPL